MVRMYRIKIVSITLIFPKECNGDHCVIYRNILTIITPRACARGKAIGFIRLSVRLFVSTKIARSGDLGVIARCKYNYRYGKVGKRTFFSLLRA